MNETVIVANIDWKVLLVSLTALLIFIVTVWKKIDFIKEKLGIQTRRDVERKLLMTTMDNLNDLQKKHYDDMDQLRKIQEENVKQSIKHDNLIKDELSAFTKEIRCAISNTKEQMNEYSQNRIHDREQSLEIQKKLTQSIQEIANGGKRRDVQIEAITIGSRELLGNTLDQKFQKYISLKGIPSDELDEFVALHDAYKGCGGNHRRDSKFDYVMEHLTVLPVESSVINDNNEDSK